LEVVPGVRLVYTKGLERVLGQPLPGEALVTLTLETRNGPTQPVSREVYPSRDALDGVLESSMEQRMRETYAQLDALLLQLGPS